MSAGSFSMRRRLLGLLLAGVAAAWALVAVGTYADAHREIDALLDAHLAQAATLVVAQAGHELEELSLDEADAAAPIGKRVVFQVWKDGRDLVFRSSGAPDARLSPAESGFSDASIGGRDWRVFSSWDRERETLVQVAEEHAARNRIAAGIALNSLLPLLLALPLLGLLIWWVVGRGMRPLQALGDEVARRGPLDLNPLTIRGLPSELSPLAETLDRLFSRMRDSLDSERRFTSQAAHELRTPIAAIRAQAEVASESRDPDTARAALHHVIEACDRASRLSEQLLLLARADETEPGALLADCRLDEIAERVVAALAPEAMDRGKSLELEPCGSVTLRGNDALLEALLRNLVDNAIRHGGERCIVRLAHAADPDRVSLEVEDTGHGPPPDERQQLGRRFHRGSAAREEGSGLGLSIVARIAQLHGASVEFRGADRGPGFKVSVSIPVS
ncbi:MAG: HAMP domain-containing protein [Gammaproteobacteria bacterium]|nr:HAMP domain-containing protein [Gammaproteobacteria bacterium]